MRGWRGGLAKRSAGHDQRLRAACQRLVQYLPPLSFLSVVWTNTTLQLALCERDSSSLSHRSIDNLLLFVFLLLFPLFLFFCPSSTPTPSFFFFFWSSVSSHPTVTYTAGCMISSVQFSMVSMLSEKPVCAPPRLSEVSPMLPLKRFRCSSDWRWPSLVLSKKIA